MLNRFVAKLAPQLRYFGSVKQPHVVDISKHLSGKEDKAACKQIAESFYETGCLIVRDPRAKESDNEKFLDMCEKYFESRGEMYYAGQKVPEAFPEVGYQHGATPELVEVARDHADLMRSFKGDNKAHSPIKGEPDKKWRYFWRQGTPTPGEPKELDSKKIVPHDFPAWEKTMDAWGNTLKNATESVADMLAIGLDIPRDSFTSRMKHAPMLLAPTASDLQRWCKKGDVLAGFHYDLNFITIHGKSRFPGLYIWLRDGTKLPVKVPDGCLVLQSAKQLEHITGGYIKAGFHEVVVDDNTRAAVKKAKAAGKSTWRISSTLFSSIRHDVILEPLSKFANAETKKQYPPISAYDMTIDELKHINLLQQ